MEGREREGLSGCGGEGEREGEGEEGNGTCHKSCGVTLL